MIILFYSKICSRNLISWDAQIHPQLQKFYEKSETKWSTRNVYLYRRRIINDGAAVPASTCRSGWWLGGLVGVGGSGSEPADRHWSDLIRRPSPTSRQLSCPSRRRAAVMKEKTHS